MYSFVFEATAPSNEGAEAVDGFAFVWVSSAKYPQAERAARAQGLLHGRWGYFATRVGDESENRPRMELRPLKKP